LIAQKADGQENRADEDLRLDVKHKPNPTFIQKVPESLEQSPPAERNKMTNLDDK
jgi:hypothetical protein